jgi:hypothetical protein
MTLQAQINNLLFEMQRRVVLFMPDTTMPDGSTLGSTSGLLPTDNPQRLYDEPDLAPTGAGALLIRNSPPGTRYQDVNGVQYYKRKNPITFVNEWVQFGEGTGGGGDVDLSNYVQEAPETGEMYARQNKEWVIIPDNTGGGGLPPGGDFSSPIGTVVQLAHNSSLEGWVECNGQELNRSSFPSLYAVVGTRYGGGNGTTTFNVPLTRQIERFEKVLEENSVSARGWRTVNVDAVGNVYYTETDGFIYKQNLGVGQLFKLGHYTKQDYRGIGFTATGGMYTAIDNVGVYYAEDFTAPPAIVPSLSGRTSWRAIVEAADANIYVVSNRGGIYKKSSIETSFSKMPNIPNVAFRDCCAHPYNGVYICEYNGDIYLLPNDASELIPLNQEKRKWKCITCAATTLDVYVADEDGNVYIQAGGRGDFIRCINIPKLDWGGIACSINGDLYGVSFSRKGNIYKAQILRHIIRYN